MPGLPDIRLTRIAHRARVVLYLFLCLILLFPSDSFSASQKKHPPPRGSKSAALSRKGAPAHKTAHAGKNARNGKATPGRTKFYHKKQGKKSDKKAGSQRNPRRNAAASSRRSPAAAQRGKEIRLKQEQMKLLRQEIQFYQNKIAKTEKTERTVIGRLQDYGKQTALLKKLVAQLHLQVMDNQRDIEATRLQLRALENNLALQRLVYRKYVMGTYIRGPLHDTELLLSSASLNQMFIRARYLRAFTDRQRSDVEEIRATLGRIRAQQELLQTKLDRQKEAIAEKKNEESNLKTRTAEHEQLLGEVRQQKQEYQKQLARKQAAMREIEAMISQLIERDRRRREQLRLGRKDHGALADRSNRTNRRMLEVTEFPSRPISQTAFGRLHGRLPWPVAQGSISAPFGNQVHPTLGTVTMNKGIDIAAPNESPVRCVADGTVSRLSFILGFGHLIIVDHNDGFYSVYARLSRVVAKADQRVHAGQIVAYSSSDGAESPLHFEIWRQRSVQNPVAWLAPR